MYSNDWLDVSAACGGRFFFYVSDLEQGVLPSVGHHIVSRKDLRRVLYVFRRARGLAGAQK